MLRDLFDTGFPRRATLVYWARDAGWLVYDEDLRALARTLPHFSYRPVVGGRLADAVTAGALGLAASAPGAASSPRTATDVVAYVAGGGATIAGAREALTALGLDRKSVKWEKFYG
jgi:ferredoxin-NADP reductase